MAFHVDYNKMKRIAADCESKARQFEERRRSLAANCQQYDRTWKGVSGSSFQKISTQWASKSQSTGNELMQLARRLRELAEYYERVDREERAKRDRDKKKK